MCSVLNSQNWHVQLCFLTSWLLRVCSIVNFWSQNRQANCRGWWVRRWRSCCCGAPEENPQMWQENRLRLFNSRGRNGHQNFSCFVRLLLSTILRLHPGHLHSLPWFSCSILSKFISMCFTKNILLLSKTEMKTMKYLSQRLFEIIGIFLSR